MKIAQTGCPKLAVVVDNATRWNLTADMVQVALKLQKAIDQLVFEDSKLKEYIILPNEWLMLDEFSRVFNVSVYTSLVQKGGYSTCW